MGHLVECDSRDPVMSNSCLFLLHGACYGLPFFLEWAEAEASLSSLHKIFQLPQTRWTQRLFTIHCLKIWARFPSCIVRYLPTHTTAHAEQHTQRAARTDMLKKTSLNINPWQHTYMYTCCYCFSAHKVGLVWRDGLPGTHAPLLIHTLTSVLLPRQVHGHYKWNKIWSNFTPVYTLRDCVNTSDVM